MLKGVNKRIVEINKTDSLYFEKAVLYLRPDVPVLPEAFSAKETERILSGIMRPKRKKAKKYVLFILAAAAVLITALCIIKSFS